MWQKFVRLTTSVECDDEGNAMSVFGCGSNAKLIVLELVSEACRLQLWSNMMVLALRNNNKLDHLTVCHLYLGNTVVYSRWSLYTALFTRSNNDDLIQTWNKPCRKHTNLCGFLTQPKLEKCILPAYNNPFSTDENTPQPKNLEKCVSESQLFRAKCNLTEILEATSQNDWKRTTNYKIHIILKPETSAEL